ncbi:MAG: phosphoribosyltransferase family protein [Candidatus Nanopelagicales bacterium]
MSHAFADRREAGRSLGAALESYRRREPVVLGLPRGGVPVAAEVASALGTPLDVLVVRKLGAPGNPELGFGAVAEKGVRLVDDGMCDALGIGHATVDAIASEQEGEVRRRVSLFRGGRDIEDVRGRTVIVVDDGLATGSTAAAAVQAVRSYGAARVIVAVPVGSRPAVERLSRLADEVVCLRTPADFRAVGDHYADFDQVPDEVVRRILLDRGTREVLVPIPTLAGPIIRLPGILTVPAQARGLVLFAHGSGSSRLSPRNQRVARFLHDGGFATLLFDLLKHDEEPDRRLVFDVEFLAGRLVQVMDWVREVDDLRGLPLGLFGASTGAAAALIAAARAPAQVHAVVSRGGRPDLAEGWLSQVHAPTLLIVGGGDIDVLRGNRWAAERLAGPHRVEVVPHATHLFEEPGTLDQAAALARNWFQQYLAVRASA